MPTSISVAAFVIGIVFVAAALVGQNIEIAAVKIPALRGSSRVLIGLVGLALIYIGLFNPLNPPAMSVTPTAPSIPLTSIPATTMPTPSGFRVVEVFLRADPFDYVGPCPVTITFSGRISVAGGSGVVSYKFLRSDGASAPIETLAFDSPGSKDVSETWKLGGPGLPTFSGWESIQFFDPQELTSKQAIFKIQCQ